MTTVAISSKEIAVGAIRAATRAPHKSRKTGLGLWAAQCVLAAVFLMAGSMKFIMPVAEMTKQIPFPGWFVHFIGACEILGALGLILPGLLRIKPVLTPLAAGGICIIMVGATVTTLFTPTPAGAVVPFMTGLVAAFVAYGRTRLVAIRGTKKRPDVQARATRGAV